MASTKVARCANSIARIVAHHRLRQGHVEVGDCWTAAKRLVRVIRTCWFADRDIGVRAAADDVENAGPKRSANIKTSPEQTLLRILTCTSNDRSLAELESGGRSREPSPHGR
jgi:hypothetical protein